MSSTFPSACDSAIATSTGPSPSEIKPRFVLLGTVLASSLAFIDGSVLNVALPAMGGSFGASASEVQWMVNAFLLPLSALLLLGGAAGDLYGRRKLLIWGTAIFVMASLMCAAAPTLPILLAGRAIQGLGAAMLMPNSLAILGATFTGEERGRAIGTWAAAGAIAGAIGPLIGGWLIDAVGWRSIFLINLPVGIAAIFIAARFIPESRDQARPAPDWPGGMLVTIGLAALTWGLTEWSAAQAGAMGAVWAIAAGSALLLLFVLVERTRGQAAMIPLSMFGSREFAGLTLLTFLLYGAFGGLMVLLPFVLIQSAGYSALGAGSALLPLPIVIALGSPIMGRFAERYGPRWPLTIGPLLVATGFLLTLRIGPDGGYWAEVLPALLAVSLGMAVAVAPLTTSVLASVADDYRGTASGLNSAVARTGGLIATALLGSVFARRGETLLAHFHLVAIIGVFVAAAAALSAFLLLGTSPDRQNG